MIDPLDWKLDEQALQDAADEQRAWCRAEMGRIAPELVDAPDRVSRFLAGVQRMLAATNRHEAVRYASEVAREAGTVALMNAEYKALMVRHMARAPMPALRVMVKP